MAQAITIRFPRRPGFAAANPPPSSFPFLFPLRSTLSLVSAAIIVLGSVVFAALAKAGGRLLDNVEAQEKAAIGHAWEEKGDLPVRSQEGKGARAPSAAPAEAAV